MYRHKAKRIFLKVIIMSRLSQVTLLSLATLLLAFPAWSHSGGNMSGFQSGLLHPISGFDHVVAMVAVGLWGGILGKPALWLLPVAFPIAMAVAGAAGAAGILLPGIEAGIALSGIILGLMVLFAVRPPLWVAAVVVGFFAVFHGHAHGTELPETADPITYSVGFVIATGVLHLLGVAIGMSWKWRPGQFIVRACGGAIALAGTAFLTGIA